jgi:hypothetical protein
MKSFIFQINGTKQKYIIKDSVNDILVSDKYESKILIDSKIHNLLQIIDFVLIPTNQLYNEFVDDYEDESDIEWVYTNLRKVDSGYKMDRVLTSDLKNKLYLVGILDSKRMISTIESHESSESSESSEYYSESKIIDDFINNSIEPILTHVDIKIDKLADGSTIPNIYEYFKDNITNHWLYLEKNEISEIVNIYVITFIILYSINL